MAAGTEARATLRRLLRAVDTHLTRVTGNTQWHDFVLAEFRRSAGATPEAAREGLQLAGQYAALVEHIAHHRELLRSYNLGLDPDERNKRMVEATARRVGFALPTEERPRQPAAPQGKAVAAAAQQQQAAEQGGGGCSSSSSSSSSSSGGGSSSSGSEPLQAAAVGLSAVPFL